jgi:hypothetical protein
MSEHNVCGDCGSEDLVAVGVFEHAKWIYRLTCWTCRDCRTVVAAAEEDTRVVGVTQEPTGLAANSA